MDEKRYEQALARAKEMCVTPTDKATMEYIFPELKSEDEKIVDELKGILTATVMPKPRKREIFAWLEKQSKKESTDEVRKIRSEVYQSGYNDGYKHGQEDVIISLEKRINKFIKAFCEKYR